MKKLPYYIVTVQGNYLAMFNDLDDAKNYCDENEWSYKCITKKYYR